MLVAEFLRRACACTGHPAPARHRPRHDGQAEQRDELEARLTAQPIVEQVFYESKQDAYERFKEQFKDEPELVETVTPDALPASFRVKLQDPEQFGVIRDKYEAWPGVEDIIDQRNAPFTLNAPGHKASLTARYTNPVRAWGGEVRGRYMDGFPVNSGVYSSYGTFAILMAIAVPVAFDLGASMNLTIAAVLSGGLLGDHCSPISDTTVLASVGADCDHLSHVWTQAAYAAVTGAVTVLAFWLAGLYESHWVLIIAMVILLAAMTAMMRAFGAPEGGPSDAAAVTSPAAPAE